MTTLCFPWSHTSRHTFIGLWMHIECSCDHKFSYVSELYGRSLMPWAKIYSGRSPRHAAADVIIHVHADQQLFVECKYSAASFQRGQFSPKSWKKTAHSSPDRARYGMYFVGSNSNIYSAPTSAVMCAILSHIGPRYNDSRLYEPCSGSSMATRFNFPKFSRGTSTKG